jgi:hypothetical protein
MESTEEIPAMKRILSVVLSVLFAVMTVLPSATSSDDKNIVGKENYMPLDLVIVFDISGSMAYSDAEKLAPEVVKAMSTQMFSNGRIGCIVFNTKPTALTADAYGSPAFVELTDEAGIENMNETIRNIQYIDGTGIGNALAAAVEMFKADPPQEEHRKGILLMTDGVDVFGNYPTSPMRMADCKTNQALAVEWASENDCMIYCVGYDYVNGGVHSMGENGEGLKKLQEISGATGGKTEKAASVEEMSDFFVSMISEMSGSSLISLEPNNSIVQILVTPEVVEASIRIRSRNTEALSGGNIE